MRSFKGASLRCGRPEMNRADPKHELNKNMFVRSGFGKTLDKNEKRQSTTAVPNKNRVRYHNTVIGLGTYLCKIPGLITLKDKNV